MHKDANQFLTILFLVLVLTFKAIYNLGPMYPNEHPSPYEDQLCLSSQLLIIILHRLVWCFAVIPTADAKFME